MDKRKLRIVSPTLAFAPNHIVTGIRIEMPDGEVATYHVERIGIKITFTKLSGSKRGADGNEPRTVDLDFGVCDCPGHQRWHKECRHLGAVRVLKAKELI